MGARSLALVALALPACGAPHDPDGSATEQEPANDSTIIDSSSQDLADMCGGDDSNALTAALAVAIANELGRWDVNTDFTIVGDKLELSTTGQLHCETGTGCENIVALLRLQDDASRSIPNHTPSVYRSKLTGWYETQTEVLTRLVDDMLNVDQGVYRIRSTLSGKYIVPESSSVESDARLLQSDQYESSEASQWRVILRGTRHRLINVGSGLCMDLLSDTSATTNIVQRPCDDESLTQAFGLGEIDAGVLTLRSRYNLAFAPEGASADNGVAIVHTTVRGADAERFVFEPYGSGEHRDLLETATAVYSLKVSHTDMAIGVASGAVDDGVGVVQEPYVAIDDRFHWYITPLGSGTVKGVQQTLYQFMNRRTGKCLDLEEGSPTRLVQRTCATSYSQRFMLTPTGNFRQVVYTTNGRTVDVENGSTEAGAAVVEGSSNTWEWHNMLSFEPIVAIEPHRLTYDRKEEGGPCGDYYWFDVRQPNGIALDNPGDTYVQLIFAGGKQSPTGPDENPFIAQKVEGSQVAIDPTYGLNERGSSTGGSCTASCVQVSSANLVGRCCACNGRVGKLAKSAWNNITYICR